MRVQTKALVRFDQGLAAFERAASAGPGITQTHSVAGQPVRIHYAHQALAASFGAALSAPIRLFGTSALAATNVAMAATDLEAIHSISARCTGIENAIYSAQGKQRQLELVECQKQLGDAVLMAVAAKKVIQTCHMPIRSL